MVFCCCCLVDKLYLTLWDPMDCSPQAPLSMEFSRQGYRSGLPCPPPGDLPDPGIEPASLRSPALGADSLPLASLGKFTISQSLLKLMSIESMMPSNHLILCHPVLLLPSVFPSIRVFSHESALPIRWPKYCSFSFNISPCK